MTDPFSLITLGAAAGGVAGKLAERAWDAGERWLKERFGSHSERVQQAAHDNMAAFVSELASRIKAIENSGGVAPLDFTANEAHPAFSAFLEQTLLNAAQTAEPIKHELLAALVAERLAVPAESTLALAASMASGAIAKVTARQLRLLALICFIDEYRPNHLESEAYFHKWLDYHLRPFVGAGFIDLDARHLAALACISYDPSRPRDLAAVLVMKALPMLKVGLDLSPVAAFEDIKPDWDEFLGGIRLTSVGSVVGGLAYSQITGRTIEPPDWSR